MSTASPVTLQINDIQGLVLSGYGHLDEAAYLFLQVTDPAAARQWLTQMTPEIATAANWPQDDAGKAIKPDTRINIAFTHPGLTALGLSAATLASFSSEFKEGVTGVERSFILGDTEESAPEAWEMGGPNNPPVHILLILFATAPDALISLRERFRATFTAGGLTEIYNQNSSRLPENREHFGFRDSISQPAIEGSPQTVAAGQEVIRAGEFILGYQNEYALVPPMPDPPKLGINGTYLVYRKLAQNVAVFQDYLKQAAKGDPIQMTYLSAKIVGRWPSGAPLALTPEYDDPALGDDTTRNNNFKYAAADPYGYATPIGSHIRRTNPRDAVEGSATDSLTTSKRHRILRRGRAFGPAFTDSADPNADQPRGTLFIALNADIQRQFEFIQQTWVGDPKFSGLYNDKDPLIGNSKGDNQLTIQREPVRKALLNIPRFVVVRAAGYFFMPSITALGIIASGC